MRPIWTGIRLRSMQFSVEVKITGEQAGPAPMESPAGTRTAVATQEERQDGTRSGEQVLGMH